MQKTSIEWTDYTSNPIFAVDLETGRRGHCCVHASDGCRNCYAEALNVWRGTGLEFTAQNIRRVRFVLNEKELAAWARRKEPARIFVCDMTDLFQEAIPDEMIDRVFGAMALAEQQTFQVLTKRAARMQAYFTNEWRSAMIEGAAQALYHARTDEDPSLWLAVRWPLPNAWLGVSCEDQRRADERIPLLLQTPAAVRFVSVEPLLGPVDLRPYLRWRWVRVTDGERTHVSAPSYGELAESAGFGAIWPPVPIKGMLPQPDLGWCVIGGESGPGARPCDLAWIRSLVDQCRVVQVPAFVKQLGTRPFDGYFQFSTGQQIPDRLRLRDRKGGEMGEWPEDLRVREFPR